MEIRKKLLFIALFHFLFVFLIQIENAIFFYKVSWWKLLGSQFQNIFVSTIFAGIYYSIRKKSGAVTAFFIFFGLFNILVGMNQIFFQIFYENFAFTFADGMKASDVSNYWGSFTGELKFYHLFNLAYLFGGGYYLSKQKWVSEESLQLGVEKVWLPIVLVVTCIIQFTGKHSEVNSHLLFTLFRGINMAPEKEMKINKLTSEQIYSLKFGTQSPEKSQLILDKNKEIISKKKNIIFLVLESVGSMQILKNDKIDSETLPFLGSNQNNIFIFPTIHNNFPGTTRSHIPIITGGQTITWGSVFKELLYPYQGATLASEFNKLGKETALISAMGLDFENLASFYNNLGFNYVYDSDRESKSFKKKNRIHTWGIDEQVAVDRFKDWISTIGEKPFYAQFLTNTTHHPYGAPENFNHGIKGEDNFSKYRMSLKYTDHIIKNLVDILREKKLLEDTIIYISGDHGEAFGRYHENNFAHKSSVYEETIKNFLLIYSPANDLQGGISNKRGFLGDIMPTILSPHTKNIAEGPIGQDLSSNSYNERIAYYHKNTHPEIWGLRDGKWKYFAEKIGSKDPQLYDLENDPTEQINLIGQHKDKQLIYDEYIANWFVQTNDNFVKNLKGYEYLGNAGLSLSDVNTYGPKRIAIGTKPKGLNFSPLDKIHPEESITVWTHGVSYPKATKVRYEFVSPKGKKHGFYFTHRNDWSTVYVHDRPRKPRVTGTWTVNLYEEDGRKIISKKYEVTKKAKLLWSSVNNDSGIRKLAFGIKKKSQDFQELEAINPRERMAVYSVGIPFNETKRFEYEWVSPSGDVRSFDFKIKKGWHSVWVFHDQKSPMEKGIWTLNIKRNQKVVISGNFKVDPNAPLHIPIEF